MTHQEFKDAARQHQIDFKVNDHEINVPADRFPIRFMKRNGKEYRIDVRSSLTWKDAVYANDFSKSRNCCFLAENLRKRSQATGHFLIVYALGHATKCSLRRQPMTEHALGLKTFQVLFTKLKDVSPGNALAQTPQYDKHEHVFKLVPEVSFACPAIFRD